MPHVVLQGSISLEQCQSRIAPFLFRDGGFIVRGERVFRDPEGMTLLIETLVVDRGHTQKFFIQIVRRREDAIVRLEPLTDPEKTPGVRRALAVVAHRLRESTGATYGKSNIDEYLIR